MDRFVVVLGTTVRGKMEGCRWFRTDGKDHAERKASELRRVYPPEKGWIIEVKNFPAKE